MRRAARGVIAGAAVCARGGRGRNRSRSSPAAPPPAAGVLAPVARRDPPSPAASTCWWRPPGRLTPRPACSSTASAARRWRFRRYRRVDPEGTARRPGAVAVPRPRRSGPRLRHHLRVTPLLEDGGDLKLVRQDGRAGRGRYLIFVHGFNTPFDASVFRFAQIVHDSGERAAPVLSSHGRRAAACSTSNYDRESANFSRSDLRLCHQRRGAQPRGLRGDGHGAFDGRLARRRGAPARSRSRRAACRRRSRTSSSPRPISISTCSAASCRRSVRGGRDITIFVSPSNDRALRVSRLLSGGVSPRRRRRPDARALSVAVSRRPMT